MQPRHTCERRACAAVEGDDMDFKLELIPIPVTDIDRAKAFYLDDAGFELLVDHSAGEDFRVVQLNLLGSLLDRADAQPRGRGFGARSAPRGDRHRGRPPRAHQSRRGDERLPSLQRIRPDRWSRSESPGLRVLLLVQRPGWQRLAGSGGGRRVCTMNMGTVRGCSPLSKRSFADAPERPRRSTQRGRQLVRTMQWPSRVVGA